MGKSCSYLHGCKSIRVEEIDDVEILIPRHEATVRATEVLESFSQGTALEDWKGTEIGKMEPKQFESLVRMGWMLKEKSTLAVTEESNRASESEENLGIPDIFLKGKLFKDAFGRILVSTGDLSLKLDPGMEEGRAEDFLKQGRLEVIETFSFVPNLFEVHIPNDADLFEVLDNLKGQDEVVWAEPSWIEYLLGTDLISSDEQTIESVEDPGIRHQWQWTTTKVDQVWDITEGGGVRVAVIDRGFDVDHEDLGVVSLLSAEFGSGVNPSLRRFDVRSPSLIAPSDHGTACAGLIGAKRNNQLGGSGAAPKCKLMLIACLRNAWGKQKTLAKAITYAVDPKKEFPEAPSNSGADIISCSFSLGNNPAWNLDPILKEAVEFATKFGRGGKGSAIFWSTGNGTGSLLDNELLNHESVIGVGQSGKDDREGNYSFGPGLEFLAPGRSVYVSMSGDNYGIMSGTNFATPCAAGIAALVLSLDLELHWQELRDILRQSCAKIWCQDATCKNDERANYFGYGRLDALEAVNIAIRKQKGISMV